MLEVLSDGPQSAIAATGRLVVSMTLQPPTVESVRTFRDIVLDRAAATGKPVCVLIAPSAKRPRLNADVREEIRATWTALGSAVAGAAIWIRRGSFVGALQRSLVTAMMLAIRQQTRTKVVGTATDAAAWFATLAPDLAAVAPAWADQVDAFVSARDASR